MKKFYVAVTVTGTATLQVEAETKDAAKRLVLDMRTADIPMDSEEVEITDCGRIFAPGETE